MSLQSRFISCGEGESGEKNSFGDSLPLVKRAADAKLGKSVLTKHRRASRSPDIIAASVEAFVDAINKFIWMGSNKVRHCFFHFQVRYLKFGSN